MPKSFLLHGRYCPARQFKQLTTPIPSTMNEPAVPTNLVRKHKTPTGDKCQFLLAKEQYKLKTVFSNYLSLGQFELARGIFQHLKRYKDSENIGYPCYSWPTKRVVILHIRPVFSPWRGCAAACGRVVEAKTTYVPPIAMTERRKHRGADPTLDNQATRARYIAYNCVAGRRSFAVAIVEPKHSYTVRRVFFKSQSRNIE